VLLVLVLLVLVLLLRLLLLLLLLLCFAVLLLLLSAIAGCCAPPVVLALVGGALGFKDMTPPPFICDCDLPTYPGTHRLFWFFLSRTSKQQAAPKKRSPQKHTFFALHISHTGGNVDCSGEVVD
jgi:hypothetical protein